MWAGATVVTLGGLGLWLADAFFLRTQRDSTTGARWLTGLGSALLVTVTTCLVVGALLGPLLAPAVAALRERFARLRALPREEASKHIAAHALTAVTFIPLLGLIAYQSSLAIPAEFARAESIALMLALSHLGLMAVLVFGWPSVAHFARLGVDLVARLPRSRVVTSRPWAIPCLLAGVALALLARLAWTHADEVRELPWHETASLPGLLLGLGVGFFVARKDARWARRGTLALFGLAIVLGGLAGARLRPESTSARRLAFEESLAGRMGYAAWTFAFDFDRDGQLSVLGGGDCAPFDAQRHTGAIDIPGNGIDEDCDGADLRPLMFKPRPQAQVGQGALPHRPTIVLVTIDGLAARKLVALGATTSLMPNLDALAARGALFTQAYAEGPSTRLSFPSMFTSRWDSQLRQEYAPHHPYPLAASERQLQDVLDDAGYVTTAILPNNYFEPRKWASITRGFQHVDTSAVQAKKVTNAREVTDAALKTLAEPSDRPRYVWVHYFDAHGPYLEVPGVTYPPKRDDEALYDGELQYMDREIGRLFTALEARTDPTLIVVTADHGSLFGRLQGARRHHYGDDLSTAVLHVPLVIVGPGITPHRIDRLASTMDILPTLSDLLQLRTRGVIEGESLWPELLSKGSDSDRILFHELYLGERDFQGKDPLQRVAVRDAGWTLSLDRVRGTYQLFDYQHDYGENHDLYEDEGRSPRALKLRALLGGFVEAFHRRAPGTAVLAPPDER